LGHNGWTNPLEKLPLHGAWGKISDLVKSLLP